MKLHDKMLKAIVKNKTTLFGNVQCTKIPEQQNRH